MAKSNQLANLFNGVLLEYDFRTEDAQSNANRLPIENIDEWFDYVTFLETNYL